MNPKQRLEKYNQLPLDIQPIYSSDMAININQQISLSNHLSEVQISNYMDVIGDTILGFYQTKDLPALLVKEVGVTNDVALKIVADLKDFMAPVYEREAAEAGKKQTELKELHQQFAAATGTPGVPKTDAPQLKQQAKEGPFVSAREIPVPMNAPGTDESAQPAEPASPHDVTPMRTMADDMNRAHGYGAFRDKNPLPDDEPVAHSASQEDLLRK